MAKDDKLIAKLKGLSKEERGSLIESLREAGINTAGEGSGDLLDAILVLQERVTTLEKKQPDGEPAPTRGRKTLLETIFGDVV